jgi:hypothetical protein
MLSVLIVDDKGFVRNGSPGVVGPGFHTTKKARPHLAVPVVISTNWDSEGEPIVAAYAVHRGAGATDL